MPLEQLPNDLGNFPPPPPHMRGWEWRESQADIDEGTSQWTPRIWPGDSTPLHLMMASPARQGLLHAIPAAAAAGYGANYLGASPEATGLSAAAAATLAGLYGYLSRRRKNEDIQVDMRRLPPGATRGDAEVLYNMQPTKTASIIPGPIQDAGDAIVGTAQSLWDRVTGMAPSPELRAQAEQALATAAREDAIANIKRMALIGAGVGVGARGAIGLKDLVAGNMQADKPDKRRVVLPVPAKQASWWGDMASGAKATAPGDIPGATAAALLAAIGTGTAGYAGLDFVLEKQREAERKKELERARSGFHQALLDEYKTKTAAMDGIFAKFSNLVEAKATDRPIEPVPTEKQAIGEALFGNAADKYLTYAALSALLAGTAGYSHAYNTSNRLALQHAMAEKDRRSAATNPSPMYAVPVPMPARGREEQENRLDTAADAA